MTLTLESFNTFDQARHRVFFEQLLNIFKRRPNDLLSFEAVRQALDLHYGIDRGLQEIELRNIVGSFGRYHEFTRSFLPRWDSTGARWRRLDDLFQGRGFAPIEVYQVSQIYFVVDGNHRVSVSRARGLKTIEARVIEFPTPVPVHRDDDLASILRKAKLV